jgi:Zn-dependent oligopeptidase
MDKATGVVLGHIYMDIYPRDNKFASAGEFSILPRALIDGRLKLLS